MLKTNTGLLYLNIAWNEVGTQGAKDLLAGLEVNRTLIDCQVIGNDIDSQIMGKISILLRRNRGKINDDTATDEAKASSPKNKLADKAASGALAPSGTAPAAAGGNAAKIKVEVPKRPVVQDEGLALKLKGKLELATAKVIDPEECHKDPDVRFFTEIGDYVDLLQLDVARNKQYRVDAEDRERITTKGLMDRELRYAKETRELENLLAKAKADTDELVHDSMHLQHEIESLKEEKAKIIEDRSEIQKKENFNSEKLRCEIRDGLQLKAKLETQIFNIKRAQEEQEEENSRLRNYLGSCKADLDKALS